VLDSVNQNNPPRGITLSEPKTAMQPQHAPASGIVFAVVNQKGGVGKTTTAVNLAASFAAAERSTLLLDLDPQANATSAFGVAAPRHIYDAISGRCVMKDIVHSTQLEFNWSARFRICVRPMSSSSSTVHPLWAC